MLPACVIANTAGMLSNRTPVRSLCPEVASIPFVTQMGRYCTYLRGWGRWLPVAAPPDGRVQSELGRRNRFSPSRRWSNERAHAESGMRRDDAITTIQRCPECPGRVCQPCLWATIRLTKRRLTRQNRGCCTPCSYTCRTVRLPRTDFRTVDVDFLTVKEGML